MLALKACASKLPSVIAIFLFLGIAPKETFAQATFFPQHLATSTQKLEMRRSTLAAKRLKETTRQSASLAKRRSTSQTAARGVSGGGSCSMTLSFHDHDGSPASWANVSILDTFGFEVFYESIDDSILTVDGLYPGAYTVELIIHNGFWYLGDTDDISRAQWVRLQEGQNSTGHSLTLPDQTISEGMTISGTLFSGNQLLGYKVIQCRFYAPDRDGVSHSSGFTQSDGSFSFNHSLEPGEYYVLIRVDDYIPQWWDGSDYRQEPQLVTITDDINGKEIHLQKGATISGTILDDGSPLREFAMVSCIDQSGIIVAENYVQQGDSTYSVGGMPAGSYYIRLSGSGGYHTSYYPEALMYKSAQTIQLESEEQKIVNLTTVSIGQVDGPSGTLSGTLTIDGTEAHVPAYISVYYKSTPTNITIFESNEYGFQSPVTASEPFNVIATPAYDYYLTETWYSDALVQKDATVLSVDAGQTQSISMDLQSGGSAAGFIMDEQQNPIDLTGGSNTFNETAVAAIFNTDDPSIAKYGATSKLGGMRVIGVPAGTYTGRLLMPNSADYEQYYTSTEFSEFRVEEGKTTVLPPVTLQTADGSITCCAPPNSRINCFNEEKQLVASVGRNYRTDIQPLVLGRDWNIPQEDTGTQELVARGLAQGNYYLATYGSHSTADFIHWHGTANEIPYEYQEQMYEIPNDAQLIAVGEGENVFIDMCSASANPIKAKTAGAFKLSVGNSLRGGLHIAYRAGDKLSENAGLSVHNIKGQMLHRVKITERSGIVRWSGRTSDGSRVSTGSYIISLTNGDLNRSLRATIIR